MRFGGANVLKDELFELDHYLDRNIQRRLAFREFGTGLGLQCMAGQSSEKDRAVDLTKYAQAILDAWDPYMRLSSESSTTPEDLRPITRVMYAAALIPGGELLSNERVGGDLSG